MDPDDASVTGDDAVLALERFPALVHRRKAGENAVAIFGMQDAREEVGVGHPLLRRVPDQVGDLRADVDGALRVQLLDVAGQGELLDQSAVAPLGLAQPLLRLLALRDVPADADDARCLPTFDFEDVSGGRAPSCLAVGENEPVLELEPACILGGQKERTTHVFSIVGVHVIEEGLERASETRRHMIRGQLDVARPANLTRLDIPLPGAHLG